MPASTLARRAGPPLVAALVAALAWVFWPHGRPPLEPATSEPTSEEARTAPALARGEPAPPARPPEKAAAPEAPASPGRTTTHVAVHVATFDGRDAPVSQVQGRTVEPPAARVDYEGAAGDELNLTLSTPPSLLRWTLVVVPTPPPERLEVRVPAADDARLSDLAIRVLDEETRAPLPLAYLEPGPVAVDLPPLRADGDGRIRIPRAMQERIDARGWWAETGAVVAERRHMPKAWGRVEQTTSAAADWAAWDRDGALPVLLEPIESDVLRTTFRLVDESGRRHGDALVVARHPGRAILPMMPPAPTSRSDGKGEVEVLGTGPTALDVIDGGVVVATFVVAGTATSGSPVQELVLPRTVKVWVRVKGLDTKPTAWLHGPEPILSGPEDRTGFARIDGKVEPGWKVFLPFEGSLATVGDGPPYEIEVTVPRDREVALDLGDESTTKRLVIRASEPKTIEVDWGALLAPPNERRNVGWARTREGLDEGPGGPAATPMRRDAPSDASKDPPR